MFPVLLAKMATNKYVLIGLAVTTIAVGSYWYYTWSKTEINNLRANNLVLQTSFDAQKLAIESMEKDQKLKDGALQRMRLEAEHYKTKSLFLHDKFHKKGYKGPRNIGKIAAAKPALVEKVINRAYEYRVRCLEIVTGDPIKPEELKVPKKDRNTVCPRLFGYQ